MTWHSIVARNLTRMREGAGLTREELARRAGLDPAYLAGIEGHEVDPRLSELARLTDALGGELRGLVIEPSCG